MTDLIEQPQGQVADAAMGAGTPQGAPPAAPQDPAQSPTSPPAQTFDPAAQARYITQLQQQNASLRQGLGLPKDATDAQIKAALTARQAPASANPELDAARQALREERWEVQTQRLGDIAHHAREFEELAKHGGDPRELADTFHRAVMAAAQSLSATGQAPQGSGTAPQQTPARPANVTSGSEPPLTPSLPDAVKGRENSGDINGFFRAIREAVNR